ncbi:hypothetical protein GTQ40_01795 [Flavobacteriaceae bacterium R38]|nr:hypothetical protein [Flavobacteriaceae bacterium R38]
MASIKNLKKDINNVLGDIIDAVYLWEMENGKNDTKEGNAIIDEAIAVFDELIVKVNDRKADNRKALLKEVNKELEEKSDALIKKVNGLK